jgi:predicted kinase
MNWTSIIADNRRRFNAARERDGEVLSKDNSGLLAPSILRACSIRRFRRKLLQESAGSKTNRRPIFMLIIFGGLPGAGKTTIARALARKIRAVHVRVDTIEQNIRASRGTNSDVGPAGYMAAYGVAEDNLTLGSTVIADSVNCLQVTREAWLSVAERAGVPAREIEVICSNRTEHRRRVETRMTDVPGLVKPTWQEVTGRAYEDWGQRPLVIDTATARVDELVADLVSKLEIG